MLRLQQRTERVATAKLDAPDRCRVPQSQRDFRGVAGRKASFWENRSHRLSVVIGELLERGHVDVVGSEQLCQRIRISVSPPQIGGEDTQPGELPHRIGLGCRNTPLLLSRSTR